MIHLKRTCDKRRSKKDGTHPIVFRISVKGKSREISSGLSCFAKHWDYKKHVVRAKPEQLVILAKRVKDKELTLLKKIQEFDNDYPFVYDVQDVKDTLCNKIVANQSVKTFWYTEIARMHQAQKHSNARNYESALLGLERGVNMNIPFDKINYAWLLNTETLMCERGLKTNSISVYYRTLRSIYNRAINLDIVDSNLYPFRRDKIKTEVSAPRNLS